MNEQPKPTEQTSNIPVLCAAWLRAKAEEQQAKDARVAIELSLVDALGFAKAEGSQTFKVANPGHQESKLAAMVVDAFDGFKVEMKASLNYKLDQAAWREIEGQIPDGLRPVRIKTTVEVDERGVKHLKANDPANWKLASKAITITPAKVGVKVERVEG